MKSFLSPTIIIGHIRIGTVEGSSCVNLGNNLPSNFSSQKKQIQGFGSVDGDNNKVEGTKTALNDADLIDMLSTAEDMPDWVKRILTEYAGKLANRKASP
jgi:hypothetical protein